MLGSMGGIVANIYSCSYCRLVRFIAFWGPLREAEWKRPVLLVCSLALLSVFAFATWVQYEQGEFGFVLVLSVSLASLGLLGVLVAIKACNACVARLFGST